MNDSQQICVRLRPQTYQSPQVEQHQPYTVVIYSKPSAFLLVNLGFKSIFPLDSQFCVSAGWKRNQQPTRTKVHRNTDEMIWKHFRLLNIIKEFEKMQKQRCLEEQALKKPDVCLYVIHKTSANQSTHTHTYTHMQLLIMMRHLWQKWKQTSHFMAMIPPGDPFCF